MRWDPLEEALLRNIEVIPRDRTIGLVVARVRGRLDQLKKEIEKKTKWYDRFARDRVLEAIGKTTQILAGFNQSK